MNEKQWENIDIVIAIIKPTLILLPIGLLCYFIFNIDLFLWLWIIFQGGWILTILSGYLHFRNR